jgi:hypothetical protein
VSIPDPITLECCACHNKQAFIDQGQAISVWSVEENAKGESFALCHKCGFSQEGQDIRTCLIAGQPISQKKEGDLDVVRIKEKEKGQEVVETKGVKIRARFKLVSIDVEVAGTGIAGTSGELPDLLKSIDILEIGKEYEVSLK